MTSAEDIEEAPAHLSPAAARAYVEARTQGLCHEGALEVALGVQRSAARAAATASRRSSSRSRTSSARCRS